MNIKVNYEQLKKLVDQWKLETQMSVVSFLIGMKGSIDADDWANVLKLKLEGIVQ